MAVPIFNEGSSSGQCTTEFSRGPCFKQIAARVCLPTWVAGLWLGCRCLECQDIQPELCAKCFRQAQAALDPGRSAALAGLLVLSSAASEAVAPEIVMLISWLEPQSPLLEPPRLLTRCRSSSDESSRSRGARPSQKALSSQSRWPTARSSVELPSAGVNVILDCSAVRSRYDVRLLVASFERGPLGLSVWAALPEAHAAQKPLDPWPLARYAVLACCMIVFARGSASAFRRPRSGFPQVGLFIMYTHTQISAVEHVSCELLHVSESSPQF